MGSWLGHASIYRRRTHLQKRWGFFVLQLSFSRCNKQQKHPVRQRSYQDIAKKSKEIAMSAIKKMNQELKSILLGRDPTIHEQVDIIILNEYKKQGARITSLCIK
jgi:hypothetical protein